MVRGILKKKVPAETGRPLPKVSSANPHQLIKVKGTNMMAIFFFFFFFVTCYFFKGTVCIRNSVYFICTKIDIT